MLRYTWIICLWLFDFNACKPVKALTLNDFHYKQKSTFSFPMEIQKLATIRALAVCQSRVNQWIVIVRGLHIPLFPLEFTAPSLEMKFCQKCLRLQNCLHEPITRTPLWLKFGVPNSSFWNNICWLTHEAPRVFVSWEVSLSLYKVHPFQDCFL